MKGKLTVIMLVLGTLLLTTSMEDYAASRAPSMT